MLLFGEGIAEYKAIKMKFGKYIDFLQLKDLAN